MPDYDVGAPKAPAQQWDLQGEPPGTPPRRPPARLILQGPACMVPFQVERSIQLHSECQAIYTEGLSNCSAFCVLYNTQQGKPWSQAYLAHIPGGPIPDFVSWELIKKTMPPANDCRHIAVLANTNPTVGTPNFLEAVADRLPFIPPENTWVYNNKTSGHMKFGVDFSAFAGEPD